MGVVMCHVKAGTNIRQVIFQGTECERERDGPSCVRRAITQCRERVSLLVLVAVPHAGAGAALG